MKKEDRFVIIMAGGSGERFWPVSRRRKPKQLIKILGKKSFLQETVARCRGVCPSENIFIITNSVQAPEVRKQLPKLPRANVVAEPCGRDTCAAVALGAALVSARSEKAVMAVLPADHVVAEPDKFKQILLDCFEVAKRESSMVTIGIAPTEPATGYGYIHAGAERKGLGLESRFYKAKRFVEKPQLAKAQMYLKSGQYRWNAGMFVWSVSTIMDGLKAHVPALARSAARWRKASVDKKLTPVLERDYPKLTKISVDFALMEKATNVVVADGAFAWDDLGAWTALERHLPQDENGNCLVGRCLSIDSERNIIFDGRQKNKTPIGLVGVKDSIVVLTDDSVLFSAKSDAQGIKKLVSLLAEEKGLRKLL